MRQAGAAEMAASRKEDKLNRLPIALSGNTSQSY